MPMDTMNSFDRLIIGMPHSERMALYDKLSASISIEDQIVEDVVASKDLGVDSLESDLKEKLKNESPFLKFYLFLKALFAGLDTEKAYNDHLLFRQSKYLEKKFPHFYGSKKRVLKTGFHTYLKMLKTAADFFMPSINLYEEEPGRFYVFLSSILLPDIYIRIEQESDPFMLDDSKEPTPDIRSSQLHKMESILQEITGSDRARLYEAVTNIDWLRQFVRLPYEKFFSRFLTLGVGEYVCQMDSCSSEINQFARVLCNGRTVSTEILQALFMFSIQTQLGDPTVNVGELSNEFIRRSVLQIGSIKKFLRDVPLRTIGSVVNESSTWSPMQPEGVEDWFIKYKAEWRKLFDVQWANWVVARKKQIIEKKMIKILAVKEPPLLPYRPWLEIWTPMKFSKGLAMGFLWTFFKKAYPPINKNLKILHSDGDFKIRDNGIEFAETFKELNEISTAMIIYGDRFASTGDVGLAFAEALEKNDRTTKTYSRLESVMNSAVSDACIFSARFNTASIKLVNVLTGVVSDTKKGGYDSLNNIAAINGRMNQVFRQKLVEIRDIFVDAADCLRELELLER